MKRLSIRWLLLGVAAISLLVPFALILSLRTFDAVLVRQTERELNAQGALVAAAYQTIYTQKVGIVAGNPRDRWHSSNTYIPLASRLYQLDDFSPPVPDPLPRRSVSRAHLDVGKQLSVMLRNAQVFNLSGVRVLDPQGCALASSRNQIGLCFDSLPEVETALGGRPASALRERISDEPAPPLTSLRRGGDVRVFVALPVWNEGEVLGAVLLSRTAESGLEWLFKRRRGIFYAGILMLALTTAVSIAFSWSITRPLSKMVGLLRSEDAGTPGARLSAVAAPKEIHALGVALDDRAEQLEQKSRYIAEFAAQVSHELKTPLTSIRGAVELLQDTEGMSEEQRLKFLANIDAATARTARLVTRLLYLARLESPQDDPKDDLVSVSAFVDGFRQRYPDHVRVESSVASDSVFSERALDAVLGNLVENALRYRREQPVHVMLESTQGRSLHLVVQDDGPGISEENQARLFERFFTTERDRGGTGLGLSIVQATAGRHGGRAEITSGDEGTRVDVWM